MVLQQIRILNVKAPKLFNVGINFVQKANLTGRGTRGHPLELPKPFPYKEKKFRWYHGLFDNTLLRLNEENAKIIVVEGPIASGKSAFAKALAEQLDMYHIDQATVDPLYVLPSGYDLRQHDHELPKILRSYDHRNFCCDPKDVRAGIFQYHMLYYRFFQYMDAMMHLLNTGQGVILERSYYSDYVFMKSMMESNFVSKEAYQRHQEIFKYSRTFFCEPHVVIYLDVPVPVVQERIRTRNYSYEQNSPALTKEYLENLERNWKMDYLKKASKYAEVLVYDWSDGGDVELIVEDLEKIDFDTYNRRDGKYGNWLYRRREWRRIRSEFTNEKWDYGRYLRFDLWKVPEYDYPPYYMSYLNKVLSKIPECQYDIGFNPAVGDSKLKILFKSRGTNHLTPRHHLLWDTSL